MLTRALGVVSIVAFIATFFISPIAQAVNTHSMDLERSSSQHLSIADTSALDIAGDMTIEAWVKRESTGTHTIVCKMDGGAGSSGRSYCLTLELTGANAIDFLISNGSTHHWGSVSQAVSTGSWHHIAVVYTASAGSVEFFYDGSSLGTQTGYPTSINNSSETFRIGINGDSGSVGVDYFDGLMDDVRLWSIARTSTEISDDMDIELNGNETGLNGYWKLNNSLTDSTSNGNSLTNNNSAIFSSDTFAPAFTADLSNRKMNDESVTSSTVLQDDDELKLALAANKTYIIDGVIFASSTSATPDIIIAFMGQTGSNIRIGYTNDVNEMVLDSGDQSSRINLPGNTPTSIHIKGTVVTSGTSGDFKLKWAQATSNANPTAVMAGSYIRAEEI